MKYEKKVVKEYWIPLLLGLGILLFLDIKFFLFYLLLMVVFVHDVSLSHSNKSANLYIQIRNDRIIKMLFRHLKVSEKEKERILYEAETDMPAEDYELLKEDLDKL